MPLYEYECFVCGHHFDKIRRVADASNVSCPECDGAVRRLLSAPALQFKGSGWYVNDYGKGSGSRSTALAKPEESPQPPRAKPDKPAKPKPAEKKADSS